MYCKRKEKRNAFNLFKVNNCENCKYNQLDESIKIGLEEIKIFYLENKCKFFDKKITIADKRIKLIFKEMILDSYTNSKNIFLFLDKQDKFNSYFKEFELLLDKNYSIIIIE